MKRARNIFVLTTGEVAKICGVAPRTASKWIDKGFLKGWRIPGSMDRRVSREDLHRFLVDRGIPLDAFERLVSPGVLFAGCAFADGLAHGIAEGLGEDWRLSWAPSTFQAGMLAAGEAFCVVVVDLRIGRDEGCAAAAALAGRSRTIALCCEDEVRESELMHAGFSAILKKPFAVAELVRLITDEKPPVPETCNRGRYPRQTA